MARRKRPQNLSQESERNSDSDVEGDPLDTFDQPDETPMEEAQPTPEEEPQTQPEPEPEPVKEPEPEVKKEPEPQENLALFFNNMVPHLQVALISDGDNDKALSSALSRLQRQHIKVKRMGSSIGDPAVANLFRQCCAIIIEDKKKYEYFKRRAHAAGRFVIVLSRDESSSPHVLYPDSRYLASTIIDCKRKLNNKVTAKNIRVGVLGF